MNVHNVRSGKGSTHYEAESHLFWTISVAQPFFFNVSCELSLVCEPITPAVGSMQRQQKFNLPLKFRGVGVKQNRAEEF